jgi:hypothetical protein
MRSAVLIALALLALARPAAAAETGAFAATGRLPFPAMTAANDTRGRALQTVALNYWRRMGVTTCPEGIDTFYATLTSAIELAAEGECWTTLDRHEAFYGMRGRWIDGRKWRRWYIRMECATWTHGIGHALGLTHDDATRYPVMYEVITPDIAPRECRRMAWQMHPRR